MDGSGLVASVELHRVRLPLVVPFRTANGTTTDREVVLVRVRTDDGAEGWGECSAESEPTYAPDYVDGAAHVLAHHLVPRLLGRPARGEEAAARLAAVRGHDMAKAALEGAVLDVELRRAGRSLAAHLGATRPRVPAGVAVGIPDDRAGLESLVQGYLEAGYRRIKLKVRPGWDLEPVRAVRALGGAGLELAVDANGAYGRDDVAHLRALDDAGLQLIEQPLPADDLLGHVVLARALATPVSLDESVTTYGSAELALHLGACAVICLKPARVGGYLAARRIHDLCVEAGVGVCCGGMLETGVGRAAALAVAALPGATVTGDLSASARYFARDLVDPPAVLRPGGLLDVPAGPGLGVEVDRAALEAATVSVVEVGATGVRAPRPGRWPG